MFIAIQPQCRVIQYMLDGVHISTSDGDFSRCVLGAWRVAARAAGSHVDYFRIWRLRPAAARSGGRKKQCS